MTLKKISTFIICIFALYLITYTLNNNKESSTENTTLSTQNTIQTNNPESRKTDSRKIDNKKENDAHSLLHDLQKNIRPNTKTEILTNTLSLWIKKKPTAVMNYLLKIDEKKRQITTLALAMEIWHNNDKKAFNNWLLRTDTSNTLDDAIAIFCQIDSLLPETSIEYARNINNVKKQDHVIVELLKRWINADIENAVHWMIDDYDSYQRFGVASYQTIIASDVGTALLTLPLLYTGDISTSKRIIDMFIAKLYQSNNNGNIDINAIKTSLLTTPESDFKDMALLSLAPVVFKLGDAYDGMVFMEMMPAGATRDSLEHNFINLLVERDVIAALDYAALMDNKNRQEIQHTIITQWAQKDLLATNEWLKKSDINSTEFILPLIQTAINKKNATIAKEWIKKLDDTQETIEIKFKVAKLLYEGNPQSAQEYLQDISQLTQEEKNKIFQYIESNQHNNI